MISHKLTALNPCKQQPDIWSGDGKVQMKGKIKVNSPVTDGVDQRLSGGLDSQISMTFGT